MGIVCTATWSTQNGRMVTKTRIIIDGKKTVLINHFYYVSLCNLLYSWSATVGLNFPTGGLLCICERRSAEAANGWDVGADRQIWAEKHTDSHHKIDRGLQSNRFLSETTHFPLRMRQQRECNFIVTVSPKIEVTDKKLTQVNGIMIRLLARNISGPS